MAGSTQGLRWALAVASKLIRCITRAKGIRGEAGYMLPSRRILLRGNGRDCAARVAIILAKGARAGGHAALRVYDKSPEISPLAATLVTCMG